MIHALNDVRRTSGQKVPASASRGNMTVFGLFVDIEEIGFG